MADEEQDNGELDNRSARLRHWLRRGQEFADRAAADEQRVRNQGNRIQREEPYTMLDCWSRIWDLDPSSHFERVEYQRRATGMIEAGMEVRRIVVDSTNFMAPHALQHFREVERALDHFMEAPGTPIGTMMGAIQGTGWHSLDMLDDLLSHESPEPVITTAQTTDLLEQARELIDGILGSGLPDLDTLVAHVREVEAAILRFQINGAGDVALATDGLVGAVVRLWTCGVDVKKHPVTKAALALANAVFVILGAGAGYVEIADSNIGAVLHLPGAPSDASGTSGKAEGPPSAGG